jgi:hypothetical protein
MYKHMIAVGDLSAVFFVFLQVFGKYVLLNLFLAILLENFEDIDEEKVTAADESQGAEATSNKKVTTNGRGFRYIFDLMQLLINRIMKKSQVVAMPESETPPILDQQDK